MGSLIGSRVALVLGGLHIGPSNPALGLDFPVAVPGNPAFGLDFPVASCKSWNGTVVAIDGVDTAKASMQGVVTKPDIQEYCQRDPGGETRESGGRLTKAQCVDNYVREVGRPELAAEANCRMGAISFRYAGKQPVRTRFPMSADADTSCASGMPPLVSQFRMLCPAAANRMKIE